MAVLEETFEKGLERAGEEAIEEMESVTEEPDVETEEESEDEPLESEEEVLEPSEVDDEEEADSEEEEPVDDSPSVVQWSGNPDELPPAVEYEGKVYDLAQTYKAMQAGWTKKTQELAEHRKQYEAATRQYQEMIQAQKQQAAAKEDPRPANPTEAMSPEEQEKRWDDINRWIARDENRRMIETGVIPDPTIVKQQIEVQKKQADLIGRLNMIASQDGYSEAVDRRMVEIVESDDSGYWAAQFEKDQGALALFQLAKNQLAAEEYKNKAVAAENAKIKRKAKAAQGATPKPAAQNKRSEDKPADNFANMGFSEKLDAIVDKEFGL